MPDRLHRAEDAGFGSGAPVQALVFDCDGVLAHTAAAWSDAFIKVAESHGATLDEAFLARLDGSAVLPACETISCRLEGSVGAETLAKEVEEQLLSSLAQIQLSPLDGLVELLTAVNGIIPMAVASNGPRRAVLMVLARLDLTWYFSAVVSADDVRRPKPAADPYIAACAALGVDPLRSLAIEDSEIGTQSARAAGMTVVEIMAVRSRLDARLGQRPALRVTSLADPRLLPLILGSGP